MTVGDGYPRRGTSLRTRLVLAFAYTLVVVIVALEIPLAANLNRRARADLESAALNEARALASSIAAGPTAIEALIRDTAASTEGRVILVNRAGILAADSAGPGLLGTRYDTPERPELIVALEQGIPDSRIRHSDTLGRDILVTAMPVVADGSLIGAVRLSQTTSVLAASNRRTVLALAATGVAALVAGIAIALVLARRISRPLDDLAATADRLGRGELSARVGTVAGASEIRQLARSIDDMAVRLEAAMRAQQEFVANASHQLRTPLTAIKLRLASVPTDGLPDGLEKQLEAADRELQRLTEIVDRLLMMTMSAHEPAVESADIADAVHRAVDRWEAKANRHGAVLEAKTAGGAAAAPTGEIDQILDNLIDNAITHAHGPIIVESGRAEDFAFIAVEDRGPGMPPDEIPRVTQRFYRRRGAPPGGSGLGLAIVKELTERCHGTLVVESSEGAGTRVEAQFPLAAGEPGRSSTM